MPSKMHAHREPPAHSAGRSPPSVCNHLEPARPPPNAPLFALRRACDGWRGGGRVALGRSGGRGLFHRARRSSLHLGARMVAARWHAQALASRAKEFWDYGARRRAALSRARRATATPRRTVRLCAHVHSLTTLACAARALVSQRRFKSSGAIRTITVRPPPRNRAHARHLAAALFAAAV